MSAYYRSPSFWALLVWFVTARTVRNWIKVYRKSGLDGLCVIAHEGRKGTLTDDQFETLRQQIEARCGSKSKREAFVLPNRPGNGSRTTWM